MPPLPPALGSTGGVPGFPVALSSVMAMTAMPFTMLTFLGLWVDCFSGDSQSPATQPVGSSDPSNSSRHFSSNDPLSYVEYCTQLMYSRTGKGVFLIFPPKSWLPGQMLKWKVIPAVAF